MPATKLKFSQFVDLLLARLYELEQESPATEFYDLDSIARDLKDPVPDGWVFDAGKVLQSRGLVDCIFTLGGAQARLTGEGRLFVEEDQGTGIIPEYKSAPEHFVQHVSVSGHGNQVVVGGHGQSGISQAQSIEKEREPLFRLLQEIEVKLKQDGSLADSERTELLGDLESIRQQLRRREPNRPALAALLAPFGNVTSIAANVASLISRLNA
jgi:hypothetical protein